MWGRGGRTQRAVARFIIDRLDVRKNIRVRTRETGRTRFSFFTPFVVVGPRGIDCSRKSPGQAARVKKITRNINCRPRARSPPLAERGGRDEVGQGKENVPVVGVGDVSGGGGGGGGLLCGGNRFRREKKTYEKKKTIAGGGGRGVGGGKDKMAGSARAGGQGAGTGAAAAAERSSDRVA